jgi:citrate lyase subunit beta / citryl-CoA lyase
MSIRPRRTVLYMPGTNTKLMEKARSLPADAIILDLEDAVAPDAKPEARALVVAAVQAGGYGPREMIIRVNGLTTQWCRDDVEAAATSGADALLFPKISSADDVFAASSMMDAAGAPAGMALWAMVETPMAILSVGAIAAASQSSRLTTFVMGTNDLAKDTGAHITPGREPFFFALSASVTAARAYGLTVLDGVYNDIADAGGFLDCCQQGLAFGFDGKTVIHPAQITPCNEVFAPDPASVDHARAIVAAFEDPENAGKGVIKVGGKMTELLHRDMALRTIAIAEAIAAMG